MASNNIIGIPASDKEFEANCVVLFANILSDPNVKLVATRGAKQSGIDLIGARDRDPTQPVGVQCKLKTRGDKLSVADARADIESALTITPQLTEIYVVTTARNELAHDELGLTMRQEQLRLGRKVDIQIWGWDEMERWIGKYPEALNAFDPDYSASTAKLVSLSEKAVETTSEIAADVQQLGITSQTGFAEIKALLMLNEDGGASAVDKLLNGQLDDIRDLLNAGKPRTAFDMLKALEAKLPATATAAVRSRIMGIYGFAHLRLNQNDEAAKAFMQGFDLNPTQPKMKANKILALILGSKHDEALKLARDILADDPTNANAASYAYQAAVFSSADDPDTFVAAELRDDENVALNRIAFLRQHDAQKGWKAAEDLLRLKPDNGLVKRAAAEAMLDQALQGYELDAGERRTTIERAASLLEDHWAEVRKYEHAADEAWLSVGVNLVTAYRALHDPTSTARVAAELMAVAPNHDMAILACANADIATNKPQDALEKAKRVDERAERTVIITIAHAILGEWKEIVDFLTLERLEAVRQPDRRIMDGMLLRARFETGAVEDTKRAVEGFLSSYPNDLPALVDVTEIASRYVQELEPSLYEDAVARLADVTYLPARGMLAEYALEKEDFETVIQALDGFVDTSRTNAPLFWLALAFANAPVRPRSREFFGELPEELIKTSRFARLAGVVDEARGDMASAEAHFRTAMADDPLDLHARLRLYNVLIRSEQRDAARALIENVDEDAMEGSAIDRINLAILLRQYAQSLRAIELGYKVASVNRDVEPIVSRYPPLILFAKDLPPEIAAPTEAQEEHWIWLQGDGCDDIRGLLQEGSTPEVMSFPASHPVAQAVLGCKVGDDVVIEQAIGPERRYKLGALKHRYFWLMGDILDSQAARFPRATTMVQLSVKQGDIQPMLDMTRESAEHGEAFVEAYTSKSLPIEFTALLHNSTVLEFAEHVSSTGKDIRTCVGSQSERQEAERLVRESQGGGAAFDTLTAWCAFAFGLLPALEEHFGRLAISQSTIDTLLELRSRDEFHTDPYITIGFKDGVPVRQDHSVDDIQRRITIFDESLAALKKHCAVLPVDGDMGLRKGIMFDHEAVGRMLEPIALAKQYQLFLLSDDLTLRQIAAMNGVNRSGWLQVTGRVLKHEKKLTGADYARLVVMLASRRHTHLSLDAETLANILELDSEHVDLMFTAAAQFIGGPGAEMQSHIAVVAEFMWRAWKVASPEWNSGKASSLLIAKLISKRADWWDVLEVLAYVIRKRGDARARDYLERWIRGHFLTKPSTRQERKARGRKGEH